MSKILVIEDELTLLDATTTILGSAGYTVTEASDGNTGLLLARRELPDLIVSDIMMPGLNGYQLLEALRADPVTATIPIIFVTALSTPSAVRQGMNLGADDYLVKPYTVPHLLNAVRTRLQRQAVVKEGHEASLATLRSSLIHALPDEIQAPLQKILGHAEGLETRHQSVSPDGILQSVGAILQAGEQLQHLIENYLYYVQTEIVADDAEAIEALRREVTPDPVAVISAVAWLQAEHYQRGDDLVLDVQPAPVAVGEDSLSKIVGELVDNALRYSEPGTKVQVTAGQNGDCYALNVQDSGSGMDARQMELIRASVPVEQQGLGLTIVRRLVELHNGNLSIHSAPAAGTQVKILLPVMESPQSCNLSPC
jgi:two-component system sensor histidine kinase/response regulator